MIEMHNKIFKIKKTLQLLFCLPFNQRSNWTLVVEEILAYGNGLRSISIYFRPFCCRIRIFQLEDPDSGAI